MSLLNEALEDLKFDTRIVNWNINNGKTTAAEYQTHIDGLPDDQGRSETLEIDLSDFGYDDRESMNGSY